MKSLIFSVLVSLVLSPFSFAQNSGKVSLNGQKPIQSLTLQYLKYEPITEERPYESTCDREVLDRTETSCSSVPSTSCSGGGTVCETSNDSVCNSQGCITVPRSSCHTESESCSTSYQEVCSSTPIYRTETYSCTKYETVVIGQRLVKTFNHEVEVELKNPDFLKVSDLTVEVAAYQDSIQAKDKSQYSDRMLTYQVSGGKISDQGGVMTLKQKMTIDFGITKLVNDQLLKASIENLKLDRNSIQFDLKNGAGIQSLFNSEVMVQKTPSLWFNKTLIQETFSGKDFQSTTNGTAQTIRLEFGAAGVASLGKGKHRLAVTLKPIFGNVLNRDIFGHLDQKQFDGKLDRAVLR